MSLLSVQCEELVVSAPRATSGRSRRHPEAGAFRSGVDDKEKQSIRAIGFVVCRKRRSFFARLFFFLSLSLFPNASGTQATTYTYFIGSFFLSSMALCWCEREREQGEARKEENWIGRVIMKKRFFETRLFFSTKRQTKKKKNSTFFSLPSFAV